MFCQRMLLQDPNIKDMADQIAKDPAFAQMTAALQQSMGAGGESIALLLARGEALLFHRYSDELHYHSSGACRRYMRSVLEL